MLYPLLFHPILKPRVWGGRRLAAYGKAVPTGACIGESWEVADLPPEIPEGQSVIANGPLAGKTLAHALARNTHELLGDARLSPEGGFPLLIKFLDARESLSVQVHPTAEYASLHAGAHLKSEAWIVLEAQEQSRIFAGLRQEISLDEFSDRVRTGRNVEEALASFPAVPGQCFHIPSGMCHALGAGVLVAEIQTPSDTTFRLYDWGRTGRELHIDAALECMSTSQHIHYRFTRQPVPHSSNGFELTLLAQTQHFEVESLMAKRRSSLHIEPNGLPEVWMMLAKSARIETTGAPMVDLSPGTTVLVPARLKNATAQIEGGAWLLRIRPGSPLQGMIA